MCIPGRRGYPHLLRPLPGFGACPGTPRGRRPGVLGELVNKGLCMNLSGKSDRHGYLIDMDGVLYRGSELIPGADDFIHQLRARQVPFRLLTNNSQRTRRDMVAKVARLGIEVEEEHIFTSAMATARYLARQKPGGTAFVIGEGGLLTALHENGYAVVDHAPDYVV